VHNFINLFIETITLVQHRLPQRAEVSRLKRALRNISIFSIHLRDFLQKKSEENVTKIIIPSWKKLE